MENSASDLSDLQEKDLSSSEHFIDAYDIHNQIPNEKVPATVEGGLTMPNQGSTSGTKTLNSPTSWTDAENQTSTVQASEDITATGQPSSSQTKKRRREDIEKMYRPRQKAKAQDMKMMSECSNVVSAELQNLKLERERYSKLNEQMCQQLQSDSKMMEQLRTIVSSLTSTNASLNLQLDSLYGNVLEVYKTKSELKAEKDELKRENEYLKSRLNRWKNENVQCKRDNEYRKNILEIKKDELRRMKDEVKREEENLDNLSAEQPPVHSGFGDQEQSGR